MTIPDPLRPALDALIAKPGLRLRKIRKQGSHGYPAIVAGGLTWTDDVQDPNRLLFTTPTGHAIEHSNFYRRAFRPAVKKLWPEGHRLHALRWHDLRHTAASLSLAVSPHLDVVKARLGHSSITVTVDRYGHLVPSVDEALAGRLGELYARHGGG